MVKNRFYMSDGKEALLALRHVLQSSSCFDEEDLAIWSEEMERYQQCDEDEEIHALTQRLPERQRLMDELDRQYNLAARFPDMMTKFAKKDAELQNMLDDMLLRAYRLRRGQTA